MNWKFVLMTLLILITSACSTVKPSQQTELIEVVGVGSTYESALQNGLNKAIHIKVGSILVNNTIGVDEKLIKDEIINYSSGYVLSYKLHDTSRVNNLFYLTMSVELSSSKIANRILSKNENSKNVNGEQYYVQSKTFLDEKNNAKKLLNTVLNDYPVNAYNVKTTGQHLKATNNNTLQFSFTYDISWNVNWLRSLNEVLNQIKDGDKKQSATLLAILIEDKQNRVLTFENNLVYYFNDNYITRDIRKALFSARPYVKLSLYDGSKLLAQKCEMIRAHNSMYMYDYVYNNVSAMKFNTFTSLNNNVGVVFHRPAGLKNITNSTIEIVKKANCPKGTVGL